MEAEKERTNASKYLRQKNRPEAINSLLNALKLYKDNEATND